MNKKIASEIAVGIIVLFAVIFGGVFWIQGKKSSENIQQLAPTSIQESVKQQEIFNDNQQQAVQDIAISGYKIVQVNNPKVKFSFEVPESWMTEIRNAGDKTLTPEEKKSFMVDNIQSDKDYYAKMNLKNIETNFNKYQKDFFPIASVADYKYISYSDTNWQQVDFFVVENIKPLEAINDIKNNLCKEPCESCNTVKNTKIREIEPCTDIPNKCITGQQKISGFDSNFIKMGISIYDGKQNADKLCSGGSAYYVTVNNNIALRIAKQAQGDEQYEKDFEHLIQTLRIINQ